MLPPPLDAAVTPPTTQDAVLIRPFSRMVSGADPVPDAIKQHRELTQHEEHGKPGFFFFFYGGVAVSLVSEMPRQENLPTVPAVCL